MAAQSGSRSANSTMPPLRPVLALVLVITVTGSFQVFDTVAVTTSEAGPATPAASSSTTSTKRALHKASSAMPAPSVILFLILATVALIQLRMLRAGESDLA